jgi:hypothetical protein
MTKIRTNESETPNGAAVADIIMTVAGIILAATPLALWASPSKPVFYLTLIVCGIAYGIVYLVARMAPSSGNPQDTSHANRFKVALPDSLIVKLQNHRERSRDGLSLLRKFVQDNADAGGQPKNRPSDKV